MMRVRPFSSDGCTGVPDFDFRKCCEAHDRHYAADSTLSRAEADRRLRLCIQAKGRRKRGGLLFYQPVSWLYWIGVRALGKSHYEGKA
jgi:hypothetical protein